MASKKSYSGRIEDPQIQRIIDDLYREINQLKMEREIQSGKMKESKPTIVQAVEKDDGSTVIQVNTKKGLKETSVLTDTSKG
jgi:hypothetical protein